MSVSALYVDVERGPYASLLVPSARWGVKQEWK